MEYTSKKARTIAAAAAVCIVCAAAVLYFQWDGERIKTFDGPSTKLQETVIAAIPDSEIPRNTNVVWCSSFQLAWNELKDDIVKEAIRIESDPPIVAQFNAGKASKADISEENVYARAGLIQDGIVETIQAEMAAKFPGEPVTLLDDLGVVPGIVGYAYMQANVRFAIPYKDCDWPLHFIDSRGKQTKVKGFELGYDAEQRQQLDILFYATKENGEPNEFALDLCRTSSPDQVVIARVEPKSTLAETLSYVEEKAGKYAEENDAAEFTEHDEMSVPNLFWKIEHAYAELLGRPMQNAGFEMLEITRATQVIEFQLDRSGAVLKSEAAIAADGAPDKSFIFDRPFLIYMKKRGADQPFFVMWVDNAELLEKWEK